MSNLFSKRGTGNLWSPSLRETYGEIDLRREMQELVHGTASKPQHGHYIVYRRYDLTTTSAYWDEVYRAGVGGPAYEYVDVVMITRRDPVYMIKSAEMDVSPGIIQAGTYTYYFEHDIVPSTNDQIFEINWADHSVRPKLSQIPTPYQEKFNLKECFPHRSDSGRVEFWTATCVSEKTAY